MKAQALSHNVRFIHMNERGFQGNTAARTLVNSRFHGVEEGRRTIGIGRSRRIVRMAWEDIGLADPRALTIANEAAHTYERLGSPEGELALAQAVLYLAAAAKSNAGYTAYNQMRQFVKQHGSAEVPPHLRNAPTKLMQELGYGRAYRYAHDEPHAYAAGETYMPEGLAEPDFYQPVPRGLEAKIAEKLSWLKDLDEAAQNSTTQPEDKPENKKAT